MGANISNNSGKFPYGDNSFTSPGVGGRAKESDAPIGQRRTNGNPNTRPLPKNKEKVTSSSARQGYAASSSHSTARWNFDEEYRKTHSKDSLSDVQQTGEKDTTAKPRFLAGAPWIRPATWFEKSHVEDSESESNMRQTVNIQDRKLLNLVEQVKNGNLAVPIDAHTLLAEVTQRDMPQTLSVYQQFDSLLSDKASDKNPPILHWYNEVRRMVGGYSDRLGGHSNWKFCLAEEKDRKYFGPAENIPEQFWNAINDPGFHRLNDAKVTCEEISKKLSAIFEEQSQKLIRKLPDKSSEAFDILNAALWNNSYPCKKSDVIKNPQAFVAESYNAISLALGCIGTHISILKRQIGQRRDLLTDEEWKQIQKTDIAYINARGAVDAVYRLMNKAYPSFFKVEKKETTWFNKILSKLPNLNGSKASDARGRMVFVSNRVDNPNKPLAGGLANVLRDVSRKKTALWFGWSGEAGGISGSNSIKTQRLGKMTLATIDLSQQEFDNYYLGFSNSVLWPVFHNKVELAELLKPEYFEGYIQVNKLFAEKLAPLLKDDDVLWIHDYHLIPLAQELRALGCKQKIGFFNHIPMPSPDVLREIPQHRQLIEALFSHDLIGMQTRRDVENLRRYVDTEEGVGMRLDSPVVQAFDREARVQDFPIGIDFKKIRKLIKRVPSHDLNEQDILKVICDESNKRQLILGIDRLDYTKGIPQRLEAFRKLLTDHPERKENVTFVQIAAPSRSEVRAYSELSTKTSELVNKINEDFGSDTWKPVLYFNETVSNKYVPTLMEKADVFAVTSEADGMQIGSKEFTAAQNPENPGVLVLSTEAGAASQLREALLVPPNDCNAIAEAYERGLSMPLKERKKRHGQQRENVKTENVSKWAKEFMAAQNSRLYSSAPGAQRAATETASTANCAPDDSASSQALSRRE